MGVQKCCGQERCDGNDVPSKNDRRCQLIDKVKEIIGNIDHAEKQKPRQSRRPDRAVPGLRDMDDECQQWRKRRECTPPLITAIAIHETRPTSDYSNMQYENSSQVTFVDATKDVREWRKVPPAPWDLPRSPSQELRSGDLYTNCQCLKRNGLQHDCPRWECGGRPECVAVNPGPCCIPSQWPKPIRGDRRSGNQQTQENPTAAGRENYGKALKTGPLNPAICIPLSQPQQQQGPHGAFGSEGQGIKDGRRGAQQGFAGLLEISAVSPVQFQNAAGTPNPVHQFTQTQQGRGPADVLMVFDLGEVQGTQRQPQAARTPLPPQRNDPSEGIILSAPGVTCCCRPAKNPTHGSPGRF